MDTMYETLRFGKESRVYVAGVLEYVQDYNSLSFDFNYGNFVDRSRLCKIVI